VTVPDGETPSNNLADRFCVIERGAGGVLVLGDDEGCVSVFDLRSGEVTMRRTRLSEDPVEVVRGTSIGQWPVVEALSGGLLHTVDVLSGRLLDSRPIAGQHAVLRYPVASESDVAPVIFRDTLLESRVESDHSVVILDPTSGSRTTRLTPPDGSLPTVVVGISLGHDALVVCGTSTGSVPVWSLNSGKCLGSVSYLGAVSSIIPAKTGLLVIISDLEFGVVNYEQIGVLDG
jgi:WD40 repeat protein